MKKKETIFNIEDYEDILSNLDEDRRKDILEFLDLYEKDIERIMKILKERTQDAK